MAVESPLNPGVPARKRSSLFRFSLWIAGILGKWSLELIRPLANVLLAGLVLAWVLVNIGRSLFWFKNFSHSQVYQNQTLAEVKNRAAVVRPLIDENQLFDIAVSIWTLPVEEHEGERIAGDMVETPLHSDIVFRGVRLADKHKTATLRYSLPTAILPYNEFLYMDARDNQDTPLRFWPFPLGTPYTGPQSIADRALDSFGISMPLLEFNEFPSKCATDTSKKKLDKDDDDDDESDDWTEDSDDRPVGRWALGVSDIAKNPQHAVKRHPFIVTRTQIRMVDETHIFNRKAFNREHNKLKAMSCGQEMNSIPDYNLCHRLYIQNGNWETRLELQTPDDDTGALRTEWAYAPYMGYGVFSAGPKDLIPIPVTREKCTEFKDPSATDPESIDIEWQLSYTGRSPAKFSSAEMFAIPASKRVPHHESEYKKTKAHDSAELWNGLLGHRFYEDAHPRRRLIINALSAIFYFILAVLDLGYWYTRTSTAYISVSGTTLIALSELIAAFAHIANTAEMDKLWASSAGSQWWSWLWLFLLTLTTRCSLPLLMLKTVTRLEFSGTEGSFFSFIRRVPPTHKERNSERVDSRTSWGLKAGVCISLVAIYYLFSPEEYHVLSAHLPAPGPDDIPTNILARLHAWLFFPLQFTGTLSQLLLNHRFKTFAGSYKAAVVLRSILLVLALMRYSPAVVGRFDARPGLSAPQVVGMIALSVTIWQAATFPKAIQKVEDDDNE
ncbi:hypothetical protein MVEN_02518500 [Mycena venus]|uniref:Uncharacterized protein n=1 Tax=Mycena venus TaxID=2733690 RepID=A0A8H7CAT1_9AGAR|nr:hypothetical protein MVEN_02518500 [Mycena venus]